ncbi:hypothetical protein GCM10009840_27600 [Pseudolysinimonas kribbensis]|uniref:Uncharacterized protein n=1 Tax=Pseudolysinimonas kribbensis TaxID=433641 RepID=A0ABQ6KA10_9MICO|nr:hypothetical protein [Pseudolysinimonas kribbensis]GMA96425.1 hypothetical protein GCM10025881_32490 [Pseudolysinimonas kribbensis]
MSDTFTLVDVASLDDLRVFLGRAGRIEDGSVRLIAGSGVLAVYAAVLYPVGLLDETPTVLGLRTFALAPGDGGEQAVFDVVVPIGSLSSRLDRARAEVGDIASSFDPAAAQTVTISLPMSVASATWAAISPPRGGWHPLPSTEAPLLDGVARAGIEEIAGAVPEAAGEQIVRRVRTEVWGRPIPGFEHVPAGAAFAAFSMGFLGDDTVRILETGPWTRLTSDRGHVLVRRRAWTLAR